MVQVPKGYLFAGRGAHALQLIENLLNHDELAAELDDDGQAECNVGSYQ